ncbi:hypothetical protein KAJ83_04950 [Marivibrio halodurans]|uniref:Uncharacterized protein n=1 Tax=Marivibrio halodurans TaxID=2039722 RepID=A0A8J7S412_9PROT|nr:hypothetical protein [Marivibrio halodurans]MBP5856344.1 hypothetical protein [Marivibrio halodurans]
MPPTPQWEPRSSAAAMRALETAIDRQSANLRRAKIAVDGMAEYTQRIARALDECDLRLTCSLRRLRGTEEILTRAQTDGPRDALDSVIEMLESERLDSARAPWGDRYEGLLARALAVRAEIRAGEA